ncbi:MAG: hypothetical protein J4G13_09770 [Dehalococcoidia bacterium]|nr:hypothetical protein [Dehalococcoidia bacterium]
MLNRRDEPVKWQIADRFGHWTAQSAMRGWSQENVDCALGQLDFDPLFDTELGRIEKENFDRWHANAIQNIQRLELKDNNGNPKGTMPLGWAAKMIAMYLKTTCYLAGFGRENLDNVIHPPIDNNLVRNLKNEFKGHPQLVQGLRAFGGIGGLSVVAYYACIESCKRIADQRACNLIEVDQFWTST